MKRLNPFIVLFFFAILASCGKKDHVEPKMDISINQNGELEFSNKTSSHKVKIKKKAVQKLLKKINLPIYPRLKSIDVGMIRKGVTSTTFNISGSTADPPQKIIVFYKEKMGKKIKHIFSENTSKGHLTRITGEDKTFLFNINIIKDRETTNVLLSGKLATVKDTP